MLSNQTVCLGNQPLISQFIKHLKGHSLSIFYNLSIQSPPTFLPTDSLRTYTDAHEQPHTRPTNSNQPFPSFLVPPLPDQGGEEGPRCLGFFMCLFILPHWLIVRTTTTKIEIIRSCYSAFISVCRCDLNSFSFFFEIQKAIEFVGTAVSVGNWFFYFLHCSSSKRTFSHSLSPSASLSLSLPHFVHLLQLFHCWGHFLLF